MAGLPGFGTPWSMSPRLSIGRASLITLSEIPGHLTEGGWDPAIGQAVSGEAALLASPAADLVVQLAAVQAVVVAETVRGQALVEGIPRWQLAVVQAAVAAKTMPGKALSAGVQ